MVYSFFEVLKLLDVKQSFWCAPNILASTRLEWRAGMDTESLGAKGLSLPDDSRSANLFLTLVCWR